MKNKMFYHLLIDVGLASGLIFLYMKRKERKEIKKIGNKLDEFKGNIRDIELDVEIIGDNVEDIKKSLPSSGSASVKFYSDNGK